MACTGVSERVRTVHASRRVASSLARCRSVAIRARARRRRCDGALGARRSPDRPTSRSMHTAARRRAVCAYVIGVRRRMHVRKRAGCCYQCARVSRVRAARRRTHNSLSTESLSKAFSEIAVIRLLPRCLRARDEAPRQSSEAPCDVSQAAWRGVDARERAGHNRACESACRLEPRSLLRCRVASRARARRFVNRKTVQRWVRTVSWRRPVA